MTETGRRPWRLVLVLLGLVAVLGLELAGAPDYGAAPAAAQSPRATPATVRAEEMTLRLPRNGENFLVVIEILIGDDETGGHATRARAARDIVKARFAGATEQVSIPGAGNATEEFVLTGFRWPNNTTGFAYNAAGAPAIGGDPTGAIRAGAFGWNNAGGARWSFSGGGGSGAGTGGCHDNTDGQNTVGWFAQSGSVLAVTCSWYQQGGSGLYTAVEFDMEFDPGWGWTTSTTNVGIDLQSVALHEFGHALGLNHSSTCPGAVMCPTYSSGRIARTPAQDDVNGVINLYGGGGATPTPSPAKASMTSPSPGSTLAGSTATFTWSAGSGVSQYSLAVGTTGAGSANLYNRSTGTARSAAVTGLPTNGSTVYVRLWSLIGGAWQWNDYTYRAAGGTGTPAPTTAPTATPRPSWCTYYPQYCGGTPAPTPTRTPTPTPRPTATPAPGGTPRPVWCTWYPQYC
jgi:hypothetical protein